MRTTKTLAAAAAAAILLVSLTGCQLLTEMAEEAISGGQPAAAADGAVVEIIRVVDGDTIAVAPTDQLPATNESGTEHVIRLLSIDTPEMNKTTAEDPECGAQAASDQMLSLVDGARATVTFDARSDHTDRYGRSLAYVELLDGTDLALAMIEAGYAEAWYPQGEPEPERFPLYKTAQLHAENQGVGAHAHCDSIGR